MPAAPGIVAGEKSKAVEAAAALAVLGYTQQDIAVAMKGVDVENLPLEEIEPLSQARQDHRERAGATEQSQQQGVIPAKTAAQDRECALRRKAYTFTTARKRAIQSLSGASTGVGFHVAN